MKNVLVVDEVGSYELIDIPYLNDNGVVILLAPKQDYEIFHGEVNDKIWFHEVERYFSENHPDYCCALSEKAIQAVSKLNVKSDATEFCKRHVAYLDKSIVYEKLSGRVKIPKTCYVSEFPDYVELSRHLNSERIIIKPKIGSGSRNVFEISNDYQYVNFYTAHDENIDMFIAQEFISGELYHCDLVMQDGQCLYSSERQYSVPNYLMIRDSLPLFSLELFDQDIREAIHLSALEVIRAINFEDGVVHMEFFLPDSKTPIFLEANFRRPGIGLNSLYRKKIGFSFDTLSVLTQSKTKIPAIVPDGKYYLCGYYPMMQGKILSINMPKIGIEHEFKLYVQPGDSCHQSQVLSSKAASVIAWSDNPEEISAVYAQLSSHKLLNILD